MVYIDALLSAVPGAQEGGLVGLRLEAAKEATGTDGCGPTLATLKGHWYDWVMKQ